MSWRCVCVFASLAVVHAQLQPWQSSSLSSKLPRGVSVFQSSTTKWPELGAWLVTADISQYGTDNGWNFEAFTSRDDDGLSTVREFASDFEALVAMNGGFFGVSGEQGVSYSLAQANGENSSPNIGELNRDGAAYFPTRCAFGVDANGIFDSQWVYNYDCEKSSGCGTWAYNSPSPNSPNHPQPKPNSTYPSMAKVWDIHAGVGGSPMLVYEGDNVALSSYEAEVTWGAGIPSVVCAPRTAIGIGTPVSLGINTPQVFWLVVDGYDDTTGISLPQLADEFLKIGASKACNLDGGGSTQFVVDGDLVNSPLNSTYEREVAVSVMII